MSATKREVARSFSTQIIMVVVAIILVTTVAAGAPAFWFIRTELDNQVWARVEDGGRATLALLEAEKSNLANLATLTSQRPTLINLLEGENLPALSNYLDTYQQGVRLDILIVWDAIGARVFSNAPFSIAPEVARQPRPLYFLRSGTQPRLALIASQSIFRPQDGKILGYVTVGRLLDDEFARQLAAATGFEQSLLADGKRIASSLAGGLNVSEPPEAPSSPAGMQSDTYTLIAAGERYFATSVPILDEKGEKIARVEAALPVGRIVEAERSALIALLLNACLIVAAGCLVGALYAKRLLAPISQLTASAHSLSAGDYTAPVSIPRQPREIATLARAFEESRISTSRALENLSREKEWSEALIQSVQEGIITIDEDQNITSLSNGGEQLLGLREEEVMGLPLNQVLILAQHEGQFTDRLPSPNEKRQIGIITPDGQLMTLAVTVARLSPSQGGAMGIALVLRDVTEEEAAQHLRRYFLSHITHEFRTPLSAINASVELLLEEIDRYSVAEVTELLNSIHISVAGLQTLIDNLLESVSIEAGCFRLRWRPASVREIVEDSVRVMKPLFQRRHQQLKLDMQELQGTVKVDSSRLSQAIVNLLSNASKFGPMEEAIDLKVRRADGTLRVSVSDRGPGISPAERTTLFRRYRHRPAQAGSEYGVCLGLSVVKAIVEEHGGDVGVEAREGGGSTFWFTIPVEGGKA